MKTRARQLCPVPSNMTTRERERSPSSNPSKSPSICRIFFFWRYKLVRSHADRDDFFIMSFKKNRRCCGWKSQKTKHRICGIECCPKDPKEESRETPPCETDEQSWNATRNVNAKISPWRNAIQIINIAHIFRSRDTETDKVFSEMGEKPGTQVVDV